MYRKRVGALHGSHQRILSSEDIGSTQESSAAALRENSDVVYERSLPCESYHSSPLELSVRLSSIAMLWLFLIVLLVPSALASGATMSQSEAIGTIIASKAQITMSQPLCRMMDNMGGSGDSGLLGDVVSGIVSGVAAGLVAAAIAGDAATKMPPAQLDGGNAMLSVRSLFSFLI